MAVGPAGTGGGFAIDRPEEARSHLNRLIDQRGSQKVEGQACTLSKPISGARLEFRSFRRNTFALMGGRVLTGGVTNTKVL